MMTLAGNSQLTDLTLTAGSRLDLNGQTLSLSGNFYNQGNPALGSGQFVLNGAGQLVSGSSTFPGLSKQAAGSDTLRFADGSIQTINGPLNLAGASGLPTDSRRAHPRS